METDARRDSFTSDLTFADQQMLVLFAGATSFRSVAEKLGIPHRHVADRLKRLDRAWFRAYGTRLLEPPQVGGSKSWRVTETGHQLSEQFKNLIDATDLGVSQVSSGRVVQVAYTRSAGSYFEVLAQAVEDAASDIWLKAEQYRSADIADQVGRGGEAFGIYPILRDLTIDPLTSEGVSRDPARGHERIDLHDEELSLVATKELELDVAPTTVRAIMDRHSDVLIISPPGGVAWDYLEKELGKSWSKLRPNSWFRAHDLDYALQTLRGRGARRGRPAIMIVHGWNQKTLQQHGLDARATLHTIDTSTNAWAAVTSLVRQERHGQVPTSAESQVWEIAKATGSLRRSGVKLVAG